MHTIFYYGTQTSPLASNTIFYLNLVMTMMLFFLCRIVILAPLVTPFVSVAHRQQQQMSSLFLFGVGSASKVPSTTNDRDNDAIAAIKAAIRKPKSPGLPLIECEFPPLFALNRLGDGSLQSSQRVDKANFAFASKLKQALSLPIFGPKVWLITSSGVVKPGSYSLRDGLPPVSKSDICILVAPSSRSDYLAAQQLATRSQAVVMLNCLAKDQSSVSDRATMAYYNKPLTYNSQVVGYLIRTYPGPWCTIFSASGNTVLLATRSDDEILVRGTNTPDLRESGRLAQQAVDERAIKTRKNSF
jgi:hypothetical protein